MSKILIVDDSDTLRTQLHDLLVEAGHQVVQGRDGADGLAVAQSTQGIELLISDYNMPEMDGVTMCSKIRLIDAYKSLPMFMLTTESSTELKAQGKQVGVMAWVVKPFNPEKLLLVINKVLVK